MSVAHRGHPAAGVDRIASAFAGHGKRAALMPYLMGGFPDVESSLAAGEAAAAAGADIVELGIPFSDPLADGPVIHDAGTRALAAGATPHAVLGVCEQLSARLPVVLMVYANIVLAAGPEAFALRAAAAGAAGLIVPDLPHDEAGELRAACDAEGLALVPLVAPTSTPERVRAIGADARGFVYAVSLTGTTGERTSLPEDLGATIERVRAASERSGGGGVRDLDRRAGQRGGRGGGRRDRRQSRGEGGGRGRPGGRGRAGRGVGRRAPLSSRCGSRR